MTGVASININLAGKVVAPVAIPTSHRDLLTRPVFGVLSTMMPMPNGQPQSSLVWVDYDGTEVLINTTLERRETRNILGESKVSLLVVDPADSGRFIEIRGLADTITTEGALDHADKLARRYTGKPHFYGDIENIEKQGQETRVIIKIRPHKVTLDAFFNQPQPLVTGPEKR